MANSSKLMTIIRHEYMKRIKSKSFIILTLLGPLILIAYIGIISFAAYMSVGNASKKLVIFDKTHKIGAEIAALDSAKYHISSLPEDSLKAMVLRQEYDGYIVIPEDVVKVSNITVFTRGGGGISYIADLERHTGKVLQKHRLMDANYDIKVLELVEQDIKINTQKITEKGTEKDFTEIYAGIGAAMGMFVFMLMMFYGATVLRGVIDEKANRIVEILASSASPFDIMLGKVIGIGCVGLTQTLFWVILSAVMLTIISPLLGTFMQNPQTVQQAMPMMQQPKLPIGIEIPHISGWLGVGFIFYFICGYFMYSSLFAAIGSAVDQEQDAAQLQFPIMLPIMIPMFCISPIMSNPDNTFAVIMSLIPFFSPVIMMIRIAATNVPIWQVVLSGVLMIGTFFGLIWISGRIFRVGILMYGKKPSIKELFKWARVSGR
ncbi:MAG: ABC transporter permease [Candidatus Kapabacteria bacterium]|nr:ABC transporter permease [Candidatus Kapabacteria bacterium]